MKSKNKDGKCMKIIPTISLLGCLAFLSGCDHSAFDFGSSHKDHSHPSQDYQKPGANIRLSHNYDGKTAVGKTEYLQLIFTEQYVSGSMQIRLKPSPSLSIEPANKDFVFSMDAKKDHRVEFAVTAKTAGKHLLNIFASVVDQTGQVSNRILAIAFYVATEEQPQTKISGSAERVIILPSQESGSEI